MIRRACVAALGALVLGSAWLFGPLAFARFSADTPDPVLALSFDDGPYPPYTDLLLDVLAAEEVQATFFVTGTHLAHDAELGRRIVREGHALANHSWDAGVLAFAAPADIARRIARTDALIRKAGWLGPIEFRPPRGLAGPLALLQLARADRRQVLGVAVGDWLPPGGADGACAIPFEAACPTQDADVLEARLLAAARPGAILVLHDGYDGGPGADRSGTVEAVRRALPKLKARGLRFETVPALFERSRVAALLERSRVPALLERSRVPALLERAS